MSSAELEALQPQPYSLPMDKRRLLREVNRAFSRSTRHQHHPMYPSVMPPNTANLVPALIVGFAITAALLGLWWVFG